LTSSKPRTAHRFRSIIMPTSSHPAIRRVKRRDINPSIHGNKLWKSSCLLIDYLKKNPSEHCQSVIDVGCGWGISGIWCAKTLGADVTSVDADSNVFPYLNAVAEINGVATSPLVSRFEQLSVEQLSRFDILIAADICFWDELAKPVSELVDRAVEAGVKRILIADPERAPFFVMAEHCIKQHCAEVIEWQAKGASIKARGAIMLIENA
jgi:predicted nicotinamide N-methyase